jgi:hypothetical protein
MLAGNSVGNIDADIKVNGKSADGIVISSLEGATGGDINATIEARGESASGISLATIAIGDINADIKAYGRLQAMGVAFNTSSFGTVSGNVYAEAEGMAAALYTRSTSQTIKVSGNSRFEAKSTSDQNFAFSLLASGFNLMGDANTQTFVGNVATVDGGGDNSITIGKGKFVFDNSSDMINFLTGFNGAEALGGGAITFDNGSNVKFLKDVTFVGTDLTINGGITLVANSLEDFVSISADISGDLIVGERMGYLNVLLGDSFIWEMGDTMTLIEMGAESTIVSSFDDVTLTLENGTVLTKDVDYTFDGFTVTFLGSVPEPATYAAIFGALALAFAAYRRRG